MMDKFKQLLFISLSFLFLLSSHIALATIPDITSLTPQQAYEKGMVLRWQDKNEQAKEYFKYAADSGVVNAIFMYGVLHHGGILIQTEIAYEYYTKAANLGHVTAMTALQSDSSIASSVEKAKWRDILTRYWLEKIEQGDESAMYEMYNLNYKKNEGLKWLKKAAKAGDARSQYQLAEIYRVGKDWFLWPGKREKEIERLYKASAEQGYIWGMDAYAALLDSKGQYGEALSWWKATADLGSASAISWIYELYGMEKNYEPYHNKILSAAYLSIYLQTMRPDNSNATYELAEKRYPELWASLSDEEKVQAEQFAQDYLATHTVRRFDNFWFMDDEALIPMDKYLSTSD